LQLLWSAYSHAMSGLKQHTECLFDRAASLDTYTQFRQHLLICFNANEVCELACRCSNGGDGAVQLVCDQSLGRMIHISQHTAQGAKFAIAEARTSEPS
jgi:hypothetical protein